MDYLVVEGYKSAADCFARESGLPPVDLDSMENRMWIRDAIQTGEIEVAIERINDVNPEVSSSSRALGALRPATMSTFMHHAYRVLAAPADGRSPHFRLDLL